jgi:glycosyltransferase involved in cell wall biosynthesis
VARIGVSAEFIRPGLVGGTEQALHYVVDGVLANLDSEDTLAIIGNDTPFEAGPRLEIVDPPRPARVRFVQELLTYRTLGATFDAFYFPNYYTPPTKRRCRRVTTIPDLQYLHLPQNFSWKKRAWLRRAHRWTLRTADAVTVYSEFVKQDIGEHYGERAAGRVTVLPIPVSWERFGHGTDALTEASPKRPYVLGVSSQYKHKNLATLIRAFKQVHVEMPEIELVLVGQLGSQLVGVSQAEDVPGLISELGLEGVVRSTGFIAAHELGDLYRGAALFVFPSIFEGFGLPPVEALGFGLPVITTRCASLVEVTRGLADYVDDPHNVDELATLIMSRLTDGGRPSPNDVQAIRDYYAPQRIGGELYRLLTDVR